MVNLPFFFYGVPGTRHDDGKSGEVNESFCRGELGAVTNLK